MNQIVRNLIQLFENFMGKHRSFLWKLCKNRAEKFLWSKRNLYSRTIFEVKANLKWFFYVLEKSIELKKLAEDITKQFLSQKYFFFSQTGESNCERIWFSCLKLLEENTEASFGSCAKIGLRNFFDRKEIYIRERFLK